MCRRLDGQHGTRCFADDPLGLATQDEVGQTGPPVSADAQQVGLKVRGRRDDLRHRRTDPYFDPRIEPVEVLAPHHVRQPRPCRVDELVEVGPGDRRRHDGVGHGQGQVLDDVQQDQLGTELLGQFAGQADGRGRTLAEVGRDQNATNVDHGGTSD